MLAEFLARPAFPDSLSGGTVFQSEKQLIYFAPLASFAVNQPQKTNFTHSTW
jgi:hypothetical protein